MAARAEAARRPRIPGAGRALRHDAAAAVLAQALAAGSSLALQLVAARTLGASGYGTFSLYIAITFTITALQTGWVGDSLTVLDRTDREVRGAIFGSHLVLTALGATAAFGLTAVLDLAAGVSGTLFAAVVVAWLCEDLGRRLLMARKQFWALVVNDTGYAVVALGTVATLWAVQGQVRMETLLVGMLAGAAAASGLAVVQVGSEERWVGRCSRRGLGKVVRFAAWRSAQAGIRPGAQFATRLLVLAAVGPAALGRLEAARLLTQPLVVFSNGFSSYLLPRFARAEGRGLDRAALARPVALLAASTGAYGAVAVVFNDQISGLLTGGGFPVERVAVLGWFLFTLVYVAALPATVLLVADRQSRRVFYVRFADSALGLLAVAVLVQVAPASVVPLGLTFGALVGGVIVWRRAARLLVTDDGPAPPRPSPASRGERRATRSAGRGKRTASPPPPAPRPGASVRPS